MTEIAQYSHENMPMKDILSEIRDMVSREAQARYDNERVQTKRELLILRPEARIDLLLQEPEPEIEAIATPIPAPNPTPKSPAPQPDTFTADLQQALGVSDPDALEALIRKVFREELTVWGDS